MLRTHLRPLTIHPSRHGAHATRKGSVTMTTDYSTSRYQNATAERAYAIVLDGFADDSIIGPGDMCAFDLVTTDDDGAVILRYDSQGFIDVETSERSHALNGMPADVHGHYGRARVLCHFEYLRREYETDGDA
jgi:hypothetical protein